MALLPPPSSIHIVNSQLITADTQGTAHRRTVRHDPLPRVAHRSPAASRPPTTLPTPPPTLSGLEGDCRRHSPLSLWPTHNLRRPRPTRRTDITHPPHPMARKGSRRRDAPSVAHLRGKVAPRLRLRAAAHALPILPRRLRRRALAQLMHVVGSLGVVAPDQTARLAEASYDLKSGALTRSFYRSYIRLKFTYARRVY